MASYETGYDDERFLHPVGHTLHCGICTNVLKDPVMCGENEHLFCRVCITMHLMNSLTCPNCIEPLTIATLSQASRGIRNLLAELKIKCEFFNRGCGKFIELEHLEGHVADCGFAPAVCSNEGCYLKVNKRDLLHHETSVCELRRVKCHSCNDIKEKMDTITVKFSKLELFQAQLVKQEETNRQLKVDNEDMKKILNEVAKQVKMISQTLDENMKRIDAVERNVVRKVELVQGQLIRQEETNGQLKVDNLEVKKNVVEIKEQLERMSQRPHQAHAGPRGKKIGEADETYPQPKIVIAGGKNKNGGLNSAEMFRPSNRSWIQLQPLKNSRSGASSVIYNNQLLIIGSNLSLGGNKSLEKISLSAAQAAPSLVWENFPAELPSPIHGHCSVVYDGRLIIIGGYDGAKKVCSDNITEVSLVPPYTSKLLATMPQTRWYHDVALFDDKIVIFGGTQGKHYGTNLESVLMYDITKNEFQELAPLPYAVSELATVKWGDDNVIIAGGVDKKNIALNKVLMYNIKTQKSHELPEMKCKRQGCVAAVVGDTVMVMGGKDENGNVLKSVEGFRFDRYSWQDFPEMHEKRYFSTAVVG